MAHEVFSPQYYLTHTTRKEGPKIPHKPNKHLGSAMFLRGNLSQSDLQSALSQLKQNKLLSWTEYMNNGITASTQPNPRPPLSTFDEDTTSWAPLSRYSAYALH